MYKCNNCIEYQLYFRGKRLEKNEKIHCRGRKISMNSKICEYLQHIEDYKNMGKEVRNKYV